MTRESYCNTSLRAGGSVLMLAAVHCTVFDTSRLQGYETAGFRDSGVSQPDASGVVDAVANAVVDGSLSDSGTVASDYAAVVSQDAPIVYLRLDEGAGTTLVDETGRVTASAKKAGVDCSGKGLRGLGCAMTAAAGQYLRFDTPVSTGQSYSVEFWLKRVGGSGAQDRFAFNGGYGGNPARRGPSISYSDPQGLGLAQTWLSATDVGVSTYGNSGALAADRWHHIVAAFGPSALTLYVDGVASPVSGNATLPDNAGQEWIFGTNSTTNTNADFRSNATIDEIAVYTGTLADARVRAHFDVGFAPFR
jgi:hypothetical protein